MKKIVFNSPVVLWFAIISAGALLLNYLTGGWSNTYIFSVWRGSFTDPMFYVRMFTHVLGHVDINHYANNMVLFLLVGPLLEEKYGSKQLLSVIVAVALVTGIIHIIISPNTALLGASGVVFAFIILASVTGTGKGVPLTTIIVALIYIGQQVYQGITSPDSISQLTHIIGGAIGGIYGLTIRGKGK